MFEIPNAKSFMDSVHGYISIPKCFVDNIIDTNAFQRLRNIDQTGMRILYHNAKHDRFSHSLGVYHLGCKAVDALLYNFSQDDYWKISSDNNSITFWAKNKILFLIACLLHDIGHAPFSHSLEEIVLNNSFDECSLSEKLVERINDIENSSEVKDIKSAPHEKIGALFILENFADNIKRIFEELIELQYPTNESTSILYAEHYVYNPVINIDDFETDLCFIARMILGLKYKGYEPEKQIRNCFIELLNGNNFDVDKLDYIIRDTKMSGISNINIDIERLLSSVCIITKTKYLKEIDLCIKSNNIISYLNGNNRNSISINGNFSGTFYFYNNTEVIIDKGSSFVSLSSKEQAKIKYSDNVDMCKFESYTIIIQNGTEITRVANNKKSLLDNDGNSFECNISNAKISDDSAFSFITVSKNNPESLVELQINGTCSITIKGEFFIKSPIMCFKETKISGNINEATFLGNYIKNQLPNEFVYNEFVVGFSKKAINVIANVLEARDYLYLWIYAHHKVIYYANFLIPAISKSVIQNRNDKYPPWDLNYKDLMYIDDSYIWTTVKYLLYKGEIDGELLSLYNELLSRKYKNSLFKSLAEYDLLFEEFSYKEKMIIKQYITSNYNEKLPYVASNQITACYLSDSILKEIQEYKGLEKIINIVYVDASYSSKKINVNNTFIRFNYDEVAPVSEIPLLLNKVSLSTRTNQYFYLYFETESTEKKSIEKEREILKNNIVKIFKNQVLSK